MKFWLDDFRLPPDGWDHWAKDYDQAKLLMSRNSYEHMSLDHDLYESYYFNDYPRYNFIDSKSGLDVVEFMVEQNIWPTKTLAIHTDYDRGREQMADLIYTYGPFAEMDWYRREKCPNKVWGYIFYGSEEYKAESLPELYEAIGEEEQDSIAAGWRASG